VPTRSFRTTTASDRQIEQLQAAGHGNVSQIITTAIDRMWMQEIGPKTEHAPWPHVEIWQHRTTGERYAVLTGTGITGATGPLTQAEIDAIEGGETGIEWDSELTDYIDEHQDEYRVVWPWKSA